ncbi:unnamed protein product [Clavelina lepadiformis]|uniref:Transmembrane protein n=1 Tax=Clavelina lepadiformis TaxID=159417 RepID=A0ABP0FQY7_CLALP
MSRRPDKNDFAKKRDRQLQLRIARLIVTDFVCWIPICIMTYIRLGGVVLPPGIEIYTAGLYLRHQKTPSKRKALKPHTIIDQYIPQVMMTNPNHMQAENLTQKTSNSPKQQSNNLR